MEAHEKLISVIHFIPTLAESTENPGMLSHQT